MLLQRQKFKILLFEGFALSQSSDILTAISLK